ncbi:FecR family protein [Sphingobacterium spiritivorum]|uniref:FecR family protein n=1 Tax=Sphingobacterium spiritivorum TaxID=258 RepID=UPI003DA1FCB4
MHSPEDQKKYQQLASKWLDKTITEEELQVFNAWYESDPDGIMEISESFAQTEEHLQDRMLKGINGRIHKTRVYSLWTRISVAASVLLLLGASFYVYRYNTTEKQQSLPVVHQDSITPGKSGATLTLANGRKIQLSDAAVGELATEYGTRISKTADGRLLYDEESAGKSSSAQNTLSTAKGEMYMMTLPDRTKVWLNAASSITFSPAFNHLASREVTLTGEAYFEVTKDKKRPFIVTTAQQKVTVLGTHFNISSYTDEKEVRTTLMEGAVKVSNLQSGTALVLKPDQQAVVNGGNIHMQQVDVNEILAWKNGEFVFGTDDFAESMRKIERWYDIEFVYKESDVKNIRLDGWISRSSQLADVLRKIEVAGNIKFEIKGRRVSLIK